MSSLDIAERRLPQDGRMRVRVSGKDYDCRVVMPTFTRKNVLRVLDKSNLTASIDKLGLDLTPSNKSRPPLTRHTD